MAAPRKVFRIEEMAAPRLLRQTDGARPHAEVMQELNALRAMLAGASLSPAADAKGLRADEMHRLASALRFMHSAISTTGPGHADGSPRAAARIADELQAVMQGSELATQKILAAAEDIDQAANNLSAAIKGDFEQGLAQDIRDRVIQIFEACNYQDLTSQRVAKVMAALGSLEREIARLLDELKRDDGAPPLHGPRLPNDRGHVTQSDVDWIFENGVEQA